MAKKKQSGKKHRFKYAAPTTAPAAPTAVSGPATAEAAAPMATKVPSRGRDSAVVRDFGYVGRDLRRVGVLAVSLIAVELILWYTFGHTSLGTTVYSWVKV